MIPDKLDLFASKTTISLIVTVSLGWLVAVNAFPSREIDNSYYSRLNFHKVLETVGKTVLRPGGSDATRTLHGWANFLSPQHCVLEVASGLGTGGLALAQRYRSRVILSDLDESRLQQAQENAKKMGLEDLVTIQKADMFHLQDDDNRLETKFDCVLVEASLTHFQQPKKAQFFQDLQDKTSHILLHEICLVDVIEDSDKGNAIQRDMGKALKVGFFPETRSRWEELLQSAGFVVKECETGPLKVLNPVQVWQDEGTFGLLNILKNVVSNPTLRNRLLSTKRVMDANRDHLNYIILHAVREDQAD